MRGGGGGSALTVLCLSVFFPTKQHAPLIMPALCSNRLPSVHRWRFATRYVHGSQLHMTWDEGHDMGVELRMGHTLSTSTKHPFWPHPTTHTPMQFTIKGASNVATDATYWSGLVFETGKGTSPDNWKLTPGTNLAIQRSAATGDFWVEPTVGVYVPPTLGFCELNGDVNMQAVRTHSHGKLPSSLSNSQALVIQYLHLLPLHRLPSQMAQTASDGKHRPLLTLHSKQQQPQLASTRVPQP